MRIFRALARLLHRDESLFRVNHENAIKQMSRLHSHLLPLLSPIVVSSQQMDPKMMKIDYSLWASLARLRF